MTLRIRDHARFQSAVLRAALVGTTVLVLPAIHWQVLRPVAVAVGLLALSLAAVPPRSWRSGAIAVTLSVLGAVGMALKWPFAAAAVAAVLGWTFARDLPDDVTASWRRRASAALVGAFTVAAGLFVARAFDRAEALATLPGALSTLGLGVVFGFFFGLGAVGRELELVAAPVIVANLPSLGGEMGALLARATQAFSEAQAALGPGDSEAHGAAKDLMGKIERFATRWHDLEQELARTDRAALAARLDSVSTREAAAADAVVKDEYAAARGALEKQLEYVGAIESGRERAVARLHHHVAVLERLRFAALHHRAVAAGRAGEDLAPLVEDLVAAGRDLDCESEAIAELPSLSVN